MRRLPRWSGSAWVAISATVGFIAATCWWLSQDRSIPIFDAGWHLENAIAYHNMLESGELLAPFKGASLYPPLATLVGALGMFIGGVNTPTPIIAENVVFVPLLALGCYQSGKLLFGRQAGMLAVLFVLGSPLLSAQFHNFMLDPPEVAVVALSMWLVLATDAFDRVGFSAIAGLAIGLSMLVKVTVLLFIGGIVLVALARCLWRAWLSLRGAGSPFFRRGMAAGQEPSTGDHGDRRPRQAGVTAAARRLAPDARALVALGRELIAAAPVLVMDVVGVALAIFTALAAKGVVRGGLGFQASVETTLEMLPLPALLTVTLFAHSGLYAAGRRRASRRIVADLCVVAVVSLAFALIVGAEQFHTYYVFGASLVFGVVYIALFRFLYERVPGLVVFAAIAIAVGAPYYIYHVSEINTLLGIGGAESGAAPGNIPPTLSGASLLWYFWSTLNSQLGVWLFAFVVGGAIWTVAAVVRHRDARWARIELLIGFFLAWLAITLTPHKDIRYDMPLMPYLAVIATGWIVHLARPVRWMAAGALVLAVAANTLGSTFGVGELVQVNLSKHPPETEAQPDRLVLYSYGGLGLAGPQRDGDVGGLMATLRADGVRIVTWEPNQGAVPYFSKEGLDALAAIAGLVPSPVPSSVTASPTVAGLVHLAPLAGSAPPCSRLVDGSGVWVLRLQPTSRKVELFCPRRQPQYSAPTGPLGRQALALLGVPAQAHAAH